MQIDIASYCKRLFSEVLLGLIIETLSVHITNKQHRRGLKVKVWYKQDKRWSANTETRNEEHEVESFFKKMAERAEPTPIIMIYPLVGF